MKTARQQIAVGDMVFTPGDPRILIRDRAVFLPRQELILLELFAQQPGRVLSTETLAKLLTRRSEPLIGSSVAVHICRLRARLKDARVRIQTRRGSGYFLETLDERNPD
jgi:DNA-binding response OmpR family regulator